MLLACKSFAQTEQAKVMYAEATNGVITTEAYLNQDFAKVDSTSMHDLAVLFYRDKDFAYLIYLINTQAGIKGFSLH